MYNIISSIICSTFENEVKNWQDNNVKKLAMTVSFALDTDYNKELGHRQLDILIYGPLGYTGVLVKESWDVVSIKDIDPEDEEVLKPGCSYITGDTGWMLAAYHSSCWKTDGVQQVIYKNHERINYLRSFTNWYDKIVMTPDLLQTFNSLTRNRDNYYEVDKNVFKF